MPFLRACIPARRTPSDRDSRRDESSSGKSDRVSRKNLADRGASPRRASSGFFSENDASLHLDAPPPADGSPAKPSRSKVPTGSDPADVVLNFDNTKVVEGATL